MDAKQICAACLVEAPSTSSEYTLISAAHGWRLLRARSADGKTMLEWRCPACWRAFKSTGSGRTAVAR